VSAAVVDGNGRLLGRITIDDVVDVIREEAAHEVMSSAGLRDEEDVFAGVFPSTRRRLLWLGINLVTAFLAAAVVSRFEGTIEKSRRWRRSCPSSPRWAASPARRRSR
jgi:magnesium transporter